MYMYISFLPAMVAANSIKRICYSGLYEWKIGLYEWKITTARPILTFMLKNILRTFMAKWGWN